MAGDDALPRALRYVSDAQPGIRRRRFGRGFRYTDAQGRPVRAQAELKRLRELAAPPAWQDVWLCPDPRGHIQATGRDARGRKQYRYHRLWMAIRGSRKYDRLSDFARVLPAIRARVEEDLASPGLPRRKVLAALVSLLEATRMRIGSEQYTRQNGSNGLTTLRDHHVDVTGARIAFQFRGKSGKEHTLSLHDRRLAAVVRRCRDLDGQELFQYTGPDGERQSVCAADVNDYLREASGGDFTAKVFRTWSATVFCCAALAALPPPESEAESRRQEAECVRATAAHLGNTAAVCRASYIHPAVFRAYETGLLARVSLVVLDGLREEEQRTLAVLGEAASEPGHVTPPRARLRRPPSPSRSAAPPAQS